MTTRRQIKTPFSLAILMTALLVLPAAAADLPDQLPDPDGAPPDTSKPVKVYIMMGQSSMIGFGRVDGAVTQGTLSYLTQEEGMFSHLVDDEGNSTVRNDVWCTKVTVGQRQGWLQPDFGARSGFIGPELQFGHLLGHYHDETVIIIKASQGNWSLGWDILPPGSEQFTYDGRVYAGYKDTPSSWVEGEPREPVNWYAGKQYDDFVRDIHEVLDDLPRFYPDYEDQGYEIAGFDVAVPANSVTRGAVNHRTLLGASSGLAC